MAGEGKRIRAVLVDDVESDLKYADRLSRERLTCEAILAPPSLDELRQMIRKRADEGKLDALILDYRLDDCRHPEATETGYRGGSVAAEIKEIFPEKPVVLLTTQVKFEESLAGKPRVLDLFDHVVLKSELRTSSQRLDAASRVVSLVDGFQKVAAAASKGGSTNSILSSAMEAREGEADAIAAAVGGALQAKVDELTRWIIEEALQFPGLLLDAREVRARLALTENGFQNERVQAWLSPASYSGVFSNIHERWWRGRVNALLSKATNTEDERSSAIAQAVGVARLVSARCVWCGDPDVVRPCSLCGESVDSRHHLPRADNRPRWSEPAVVCFRCIQTGRADGVAFAPGAELFYRRLRDGEVKRAGESGDT